MPEPAGTGNTAPGLTSATILLFIWSVLTFAVRAWVKLRQSDSWGIDDTTITASLLFALFHLIATCYAVNHGYGNPWDVLSVHDNDVAKKALYAAQLFYVTSIGLTKSSISLFNTRLTRERANVRIAYGITGLCGLWTIASIFTLSVRGDLSRPWDTVDGSDPMFVRWLGIEVVACFVEFSLWAASMYFIWGLHMPLSKRLSIGSIFACRLILIPAVGVRLWYLSPSKNPDLNHPAMKANIFTEISLFAAFMLSNITCLKPFLRPFHSGVFVSTTDGKTSGYRTTKASASRGDTYYMLSTARSTADNKDGVIVQGEGESISRASLGEMDRNGIRAPNFRPDYSSHRATVLTGNADRIDPVEREGSEEMIISKTQAWTVSYEEEVQKNSTNV